MEKIKIRCFVSKKDDKILNLEEFLSKDRDKKDYTEMFFEISPLSWKESHDIKKNCYVKDEETGVISWDGHSFVQNKLLKILKGWNFKNENFSDKESVPPIDMESVYSLDPKIGDFILKEYDKHFQYDDNKRRELMRDIRRYYIAQAENNNEINAPKEVIDVMLSEKFNWTPQEIDSIPQYRIEEYMLVMNTKHSSYEEYRLRKEAEKEKIQPGKSVKKKIQL